MLEHKQKLFEQIKLIVTEHKLKSLEYILRQPEHGIRSEEQLVLLTQFLIDQHDAIKLESMRLGEVIRARPDLLDALTHIIANGIAQSRQLAAMTADDAAAAPDVVRQGSDDHPPPLPSPLPPGERKKDFLIVMG